MTLTVPNLDDRRFQDLVDEAKRMVQKRCPEWTDHNVSDPGVTLIETFAYMVDQLLYRLNRVPDRLYVEFLNLLGVELYPPTAAKAPVTFWLSAPQPQPVSIPAGTTVATLRTETEEAIVYTVIQDLLIQSCSLKGLMSSIRNGRMRDHTDRFEMAGAFRCFDQPPKVGDAFLIGLTNAVPSCTVLIDIECETDGVGVDPKRPPLRWEASDGKNWVPCEVAADGTGGLNRSGEVTLHVPAAHVASDIRGMEAGWLRCRVVEADPDQPTYLDCPRIRRVAVATIAGTTQVVNAEIHHEEILGVSEGVPGQRFALKHRPVVAENHPPILEVATGDGGWQEWKAIESFGLSEPGDLHFGLDPTVGEIVLGPAVREKDGSLRNYGAVPPASATLRLRSYQTGGGRHGNVGAGAISVLKSSIPFVGRVENRRPATEGVDAEDIESAKRRGPLLLHTRNRAVTAEDYELLTREALPEIARVHTVCAGEGADAGAVRVLIVPAAPEVEPGRLRFEDLVPDEEDLLTIVEYLDERRVIGARVVVEPPTYQGVTVIARVRARRPEDKVPVQAAAEEALYRYLNPVTGGPEGQGWPFGRELHLAEIYSVLQRVPGTDFVEEVRLFPADPITGKRESRVDLVELGDHSLIFSYGHEVRAEND
jgi:predicted phage baseplate assembly protein